MRNIEENADMTIINKMSGLPRPLIVGKVQEQKGNLNVINNFDRQGDIKHERGSEGVT